MEFELKLKVNSHWAGLSQRFGSPPGRGNVDILLTDSDGTAAGLTLLLHRPPAEAAAHELGFYLEHADSTLVEISPGPATTREAVARGWKFAVDLGLVPVRLSPGENSLLAQLRGLEDSRLPALEQAALLAVGMGRALDSGVTGPQELNRLTRLAWPDEDSPFAVVNQLDPPARFALLEDARLGLGLSHLPDRLRRDLRTGTGLAERRVELKLEDHRAHIRLSHPQILNALDADMLRQLDECWQEAESHDSVRAIVLEAAGPAFMAGIDLDPVLSWMEADELEPIVGFVEAAHRFLARVDASTRHTLVRLHGLAVGAGAEFCTAFDTVVATPRGSLGFPETSIGIYPAMGGTQRLPRRVGYPAARWLVLSGTLLAARRALPVRLVDLVVDESRLDAEIRRAAAMPPGHERAGRKIHADQASANPLFDRLARRSLDQLLHPSDLTDRDARNFSLKLGTRSALALRTADTLLKLSLDHALPAGLDAELAGLPEIYRSEDALLGIRRAVSGTGHSPAG